MPWRAAVLLGLALVGAASAARADEASNAAAHSARARSLLSDCPPDFACAALVADAGSTASSPTPFAAASADAAPHAAPAGPVHFPSVDAAAAAFSSSDPHLQAMFRAALENTGKQASWAADGTVYVQTGDIPAEWLRDSSAQVRPYLLFANGNPDVDAFLKAVIERQAKSLSADPYANAFRKDYSVWEEKFELDSLCYPIILAWTYWKATGDASVFTPEVADGFGKALEVMIQEQNHATAPRHYTRNQHPVGDTKMIWTGFRPSDDACQYNFLIPSEMMAVVALGELAEIERDVYKNSADAARAENLRGEVDGGIRKFGIVSHPKFGRIYAYEVDGLGRANLMDDANLPSLLSAPYFGYASASDPVYEATRRFVLSPSDPEYDTGKDASGVGSPHTDGHGRWVWPLSLLAQGITSTSSGEKSKVLSELLASDPGDGRLHESFDPNDPKRFTRKDFGWPNALLAEWVLETQGGRAALPSGGPDAGAQR
jgi:meiotically up-regulated gene 157 (Mug157) protein